MLNHLNIRGDCELVFDSSDTIDSARAVVNQETPCDVTEISSEFFHSRACVCFNLIVEDVGFINEDTMGFVLWNFIGWAFWLL